jgi:hypothetical protein
VLSTDNLLEGRTAKCACGDTAASSKTLPFFEYCGPGSKNATIVCAVCRYHKVAHGEINESTRRPGIVDHDFEPAGDSGEDRFYCGHRGWD